MNKRTVTYLTTTMVFAALMTAWIKRREVNQETLIMPVNSIDVVSPIRIMRDGEIEDAIFTYPFNLN